MRSSILVFPRHFRHCKEGRPQLRPNPAHAKYDRQEINGLDLLLVSSGSTYDNQAYRDVGLVAEKGVVPPSKLPVPNPLEVTFEMRRRSACAVNECFPASNTGLLVHFHHHKLSRLLTSPSDRRCLFEANKRSQLRMSRPYSNARGRQIQP
jgi:hypothetical protein